MLGCAALYAYTPTTCGQTMVEVPMLAVAQLGVNAAGEVDRCGLEIVGVITAEKETRVFDVSLYAYSSGRGLAKLTAQMGATAKAPAEMSPVDIFDGWIRAQGMPAAKAISPLIDGETPKSKLYAADLKATAETLYSIANGSIAQVSISWRPGRSTVYFGKPKIEPGHSTQFAQCMNDLAATVEHELQREAGAKK
jgi:hypothetical protein